MSTVDDTAITIADSYAEALLALSEEKGCSDELLDELSELTSGLETDQVLAHFLTSPAVDDDVRREGLEKAFRGRLSDLLVDTLQVLNEKGRTELLPTLYERYRLGLERIRGEVDVHVTSAFPMSDASRQRLTDVLRDSLELTPRLIEKVDANMLGGLVIQVGDKKMDCSASHRLRQLRERFRDRASREIHAGKDYFEAAES